MINPETGQPYVRLSVNVNDATAEVIKGICEAKGINATEWVRRAAAIFDLMHSETANGGQVEVIKRDGQRVTVELL